MSQIRPERIGRVDEGLSFEERVSVGFSPSVTLPLKAQVPGSTCLSQPPSHMLPGQLFTCVLSGNLVMSCVRGGATLR